MDATKITTYDDLRQIARKFAAGGINFLLLTGRPGLMKTETIKQACSGKPMLTITGKKSPVDLYRDLFFHRHQLVVLDDVEPLLNSRDGQVLIRDLTETTLMKSISWQTQNAILRRFDPPVPAKFDTSSCVCIIANNWKTTGIFEAIGSRALRFAFAPSWAEVYTEAGQWFRDQEVLDYVYDHLGAMKNPDVRLLNKAVEMRSLNLRDQNWRSVFDACMDSDKTDREIARLLADTTLTQKERVAKFMAGGFGDRSTFFRRIKKTQVAQPVSIPPRIMVSTTPKKIRKATAGRRRFRNRSVPN